MPIRRRLRTGQRSSRCRPTPGPRSPPRCARRSASTHTPRFSNTPPSTRPPCHQSVGVPGVMARPRHRHHRRPMGGAIHPRRIGLQHHLDRSPIQPTPAPPTLTPVIERRLALAAPTAAQHPAARPHPRHHQLDTIGRLLAELESSITVRLSTPNSPRHNLTLRTSLPAPLVPDLRQARNLKRQRRAPPQTNHRPTEESEEPFLVQWPRTVSRQSAWPARRSRSAAPSS